MPPWCDPLLTYTRTKFGFQASASVSARRIAAGHRKGRSFRAYRHSIRKSFESKNLISFVGLHDSPQNHPVYLNAGGPSTHCGNFKGNEPLRHLENCKHSSIRLIAEVHKPHFLSPSSSKCGRHRDPKCFLQCC